MAVEVTPAIQPAPPRPPNSFTYEWANQLTRWLSALADQQAGFTYLRGSGLFLPNLSPTGYGLRAGEVFENAGILTVVRVGDIWIGSLAITSAVGSVTVTV